MLKRKKREKRKGGKGTFYWNLNAFLSWNPATSQFFFSFFLFGLEMELFYSKTPKLLHHDKFSYILYLSKYQILPDYMH